MAINSEWDISTCKIEYKESEKYLLSSLGLSLVDFDFTRDYLIPYQLKIVKYLNRFLMNLGTDSIKVKIDKIFALVKEQTDIICDPVQGGDVLARKLSIDTEAEVYNTDRFVYSWTNALTSLCMRLKFQYGYLFDQEKDPSWCGCIYPKGETEDDYEHWTSGVNPEDETYDRTDYLSSNSWTVTKNSNCDCYRRSNNE